MRPSPFILALVLALLPTLAVAQASPVGRWKTIDDETGKVKSIVEVTATGDVHSGRVVQVLHSTRGPNPKCDKCKGANAGKPVEGLTILWGLTPGGDGWDDGTILDPGNGKTYKARAKLLDGGRKLGVSGCVAFICREQVWIRE
jgi:uncharacterized protein (DUF2147 family)